MPANFTGTESPIDVFNTVLADFSQQRAEIIYEGGIAYLKLQSDVPTDFVCKYRLDNLLLPLFPQCEALYDHYVSMGYALLQARDKLVRTLAYAAMSNFLTRFAVFHLQMFIEADDETQFTTETILIQSLTTAYSKPENQDKVSRSLSLSVRQRLDTFMEGVTKRRREYIGGFLNRLSLLTVPMGEGRPPGSKKLLEVRQREAAEFEKKIEEAILRLFQANGKMPTKTAVADALGLGGVNPHKGTDTRLRSFINKLGRMGVDYEAIVQRLDLHE